MMSSMTLRLSNRLPVPGLDFPIPWVQEFEQDLMRSALRRVRILAITLIVIESVLLFADLLYLQSTPMLLAWRTVVLLFLLSFQLLTDSHESEFWRLRYFLGCTMLLSCWISVILAELSGDLSTFTLGALGVAATCPLPGRFNASLFVLAAALLMGWLCLQFPASDPYYWFSNVIATCVICIVVEHHMFEAALCDFTQRKVIERERERADDLLYNVFPESVATALKQGHRSVASHGEVTILFADVVGFTQLATRLLPSQLLSVLEALFEQFDECTKRHGVEKMKTVGDAYIAIAGAPVMVDHPIERMADYALDILQVSRHFSEKTHLDLVIRIGIHSGPVVAGVVGSSRLCYDLWGDTVNTAQRIESHGTPAAINVSEPVYYALRDKYRLEDCGLIDLKGKGPTRLFHLCGKLEMHTV